jgi:hypothetical protein
MRNGELVEGLSVETVGYSIALIPSIEGISTIYLYVAYICTIYKPRIYQLIEEKTISCPIISSF